MGSSDFSIPDNATSVTFELDTDIATETNNDTGTASAADMYAQLQNDFGDDAVSAAMQRYLTPKIAEAMKERIDADPDLTAAEKEIAKELIDTEMVPQGDATEVDGRVAEMMDADPLTQDMVDFMADQAIELMKEDLKGSSNAPSDSDQVTNAGQNGGNGGNGNVGGNGDGNTVAGTETGTGTSETGNGDAGAVDGEVETGETQETTEPAATTDTEEPAPEEAPGGTEGGGEGGSFFMRLMMMLGELLGKKMEELADKGELLNSGEAGETGTDFGKNSAAFQAASKEVSMMSEVLATAAKMGDSLATIVRKG